MYGLQGVRNLRELFTKQQADPIDSILNGGPCENNFFTFNKQSQLNWKQKQAQNQSRYMGLNSREGSFDKSMHASKLPIFARDRSPPDQKPQIPRFSIANQGSHKKQQQMEYLQKSQVIQYDHDESRPLQKTARTYRVQKGNQSSARDMEQQRSSQRRNSQDPQPRSARMEKQYLQLGSIIQNREKEKAMVLNNSSEREKQLRTMRQHGINRNHFNFLFVIGKGGFGKVWKVEVKKSKNLYAMKEMSKAKILSKKSVNSVMNERILLQTTKHPFLVNMVEAFQDRDNLYLLMDLLTGGDLRFHIGRLQRFSECQTKFFIACMYLALEHLHDNNIIHRDIKPENLVLDSKGYLRVTDLGVARIIRPDNSADTSGTPGYMAPEVMCRQNHGIAVDYYAMGIIGYEFMLGKVDLQYIKKRPYVGRSRREIRDQILSRQAQIKRTDIPEGWSIEAADFINRLLQRKPQNRMGYVCPQDVKSHPWFKNYPWDLVLTRQLEAPYIPRSIDDNFDYQQQISSDNDSQDDLIQQNVLQLKRKSIQNLFHGYSADSPQPTTKSTANTSMNQNTCAQADKTQY